jgi:hypothetical protein
MKRKRMSPEEWAESEARAQARIRSLRELEARGRAKLAAEKEARERPPHRRGRFLGFR